VAQWKTDNTLTTADVIYARGLWGYSIYYKYISFLLGQIFDAVKDLHYADLRDEHQLHVQMSKFSGYFVLGILVLILQAFKQVYFLAQAEYIKFQ